MKSLVNKLRPRELSLLLGWLNIPRLRETSVLSSDPEYNSKRAALLDETIRDMIEPLIEWLNDARRWSQRGSLKYSERKKFEEMKRSGRRVRQTMNPETWRLALPVLNTMIRHCKVFPEITSPTKTGWHIRWLPDPGASGDQCLMIIVTQKILSLAERDVLFRVRRCAYERCRRWFDGKNPKKEFHAEKCRNNAYYSDLTAETIQKKRKYMRKKMREWRQRNKSNVK
jgi:hypothetical protein